MQNFLIALLICSVTMSVLALLYMASTPFLSKRYSEKGRYYVWLIIILGLIIPFRPQWDGALVSVEVPANAPVSVMLIGETLDLDTQSQPFIENAIIADTTLSISLWQIGFVVWLMGAMAFIALHCIKHYRFAKAVRRWSIEITDEQVLSLLGNLKTEMGIMRRIPIYLCTFAGSPMMIGLIKPKILLPTIDLPQDKLLFILKHELVHYKRRDLLYKCLVMAATALHWFNPVVYMMNRAINVLCEASCDAEVLRDANMNTRQFYGGIIIDVAQNSFKTALSTNFYGGRNIMKKRILSIMDMSKKKAGILVACVIMFSMLAASGLFAVQAQSNHSPANTNSDERIYYNANTDPALLGAWSSDAEYLWLTWPMQIQIQNPPSFAEFNGNIDAFLEARQLYFSRYDLLISSNSNGSLNF